MKKVLVLAAAIALFAAPAMALVTTTDHDLSAGGGNVAFTGASDEICVYCHTPHGGLAGGTMPLWNRTNPAAPITWYNSTTITAAIKGNGAGAQDHANSDAILCLSCHDGSSITGGLQNEPNSGAVNVAATGGWTGGGEANLTGDMSNDHPVGFTYLTASTADGEIRDIAAVQVIEPKITLFAGEMWCSSCHDVHNGADDFLVTTNAGSALCKACHIK